MNNNWEGGATLITEEEKAHIRARVLPLLAEEVAARRAAAPSFIHAPPAARNAELEAPHGREHDCGHHRLVRLPRAVAAGVTALAALARTDGVGGGRRQLLPFLVQTIAAASANTPLLQGSLRALRMLSEDITDQQLAAAVPHLFPALLRLAAADALPASMRSRAIGVYHSCTAALTTIEGAESHEQVVAKFLVPTLPQWAGVFLAALAAPLSGPDFRLRQAALRAVNYLVEQHPERMRPYLPNLLKALLQSVAALVPAHDRLVRMAEADALEYDSDGDAVGMEAFLAQAFEFLQALQEDLQQFTQPHLPALVPLVMGFARPTAAEIQGWSEDPDSFVAFEDDLMQARQAAPRTSSARARDLRAPVAGPVRAHERAGPPAHADHERQR